MYIVYIHTVCTVQCTAWIAWMMHYGATSMITQFIRTKTFLLKFVLRFKFIIQVRVYLSTYMISVHFRPYTIRYCRQYDFSYYYEIKMKDSILI